VEEGLRAARILTMDPDQPVIVDGGLIMAGGRVTALGPWQEVRGRGPYRDLGSVTIVPGLINAHVHLGFAHLAGRIPAELGFTVWADRLFACRGEKTDPKALRRAVRLMREHGVACVGDIVGRDAELIREILDAQEVGGHLFREWTGSGRAPEPRSLPGRWSLAVHALYSCRAEQARRVKAWCAERDLPFSLHLAEVPGENEFFLRGAGSFADFVQARRLLPKNFASPGLRAVPFAHGLGLLDQHTLAVHCVHVREDDAEILAQSGASVCLCPRSNAWIGVGQAPAAMLRAAGISLCVGTDSPASVPDLDLWADLRAVRDMLPGVSLHELLVMVTRNPARILGVEAEFGCLRVGMRAAWAVLPEDFAEML
jgi:cytosine/adenosine deaminase-related metal-dependent hydrolase